MININGLNILEIKVFPGNHKPYYITSKGIEKGTYLRFGTHNKRIKGALLKDLQRETLGKYFDQEGVSNTDLCDLSSSLFHTLYKQAMSEEFLLAEHILIRDAISQKLVPTVAGVVFLAKNPSNFFTLYRNFIYDI